MVKNVLSSAAVTGKPVFASLATRASLESSLSILCRLSRCLEQDARFLASCAQERCAPSKPQASPEACRGAAVRNGAAGARYWPLLVRSRAHRCHALDVAAGCCAGLGASTRRHGFGSWASPRLAPALVCRSPWPSPVSCARLPNGPSFWRAGTSASRWSWRPMER